MVPRMCEVKRRGRRDRFSYFFACSTCCASFCWWVSGASGCSGLVVLVVLVLVLGGWIKERMMPGVVVLLVVKVEENARARWFYFNDVLG